MLDIWHFRLIIPVTSQRLKREINMKLEKLRLKSPHSLYPFCFSIKSFFLLVIDIGYDFAHYFTKSQNHFLCREFSNYKLYH